jgi:AcrR family transcriptional regulator
VRKVNEARRVQKRQAILDAAARCFRRSGFRGASIADICAEAGIGAGNLYHYFPSKEAMVEEIAEQDMERAAAVFDQLDDAEDLLGFLEGNPELFNDTGYAIDDVLFLEIVAEATRNPTLAAIRRRIDARIRMGLREVLENARARGAISPAVDPTAASWILLTLFDALSLRRLVDGPEEATRGTALLMEQIRRILQPTDGDSA